MTTPISPQKKPYVMEVDAGRYAWCACGKSKKQPYCDGSHAGSGIGPMIEVIKEKKTVAWCGCKMAGKKPFCDGTHSRI